jgi:hypothetical protein
VPARLLARTAPFVLGALAGAIWLRRRRLQGRELPAPPGRALPAPPGAVPAQTERLERRPVDIVTIVDDLLDVRQ